MTIIWRLQVQSWLQANNSTGILNTCTQLWLMESEQATPVYSIKDSFIWPIDRTLSGATTPSQSGSGSYGNEGVLSKLQCWSLTIRWFDIISRTIGEVVGSYPSADPNRASRFLLNNIAELSIMEKKLEMS